MGNPNLKESTTLETVHEDNVLLDFMQSMAPVPRGNYEPPGGEHIWALGEFRRGWVVR